MVCARFNWICNEPIFDGSASTDKSAAAENCFDWFQVFFFFYFPFASFVVIVSSFRLITRCSIECTFPSLGAGAVCSRIFPSHPNWTLFYVDLCVCVYYKTDISAIVNIGWPLPCLRHFLRLFSIFFASFVIRSIYYSKDCDSRLVLT